MALSLRSLFINDFPLDRIGFTIEAPGPDGWRDGLSVRDRTSRLPGRVGVVALAREFESTPREMVIGAIQRGTTMAELIEFHDELKSRLYDGVIEVKFSDDESRTFYALCMDVRIVGIDKGLNSPHHRLRITLRGQDPIIYEREAEVVGFTSDASETPLGSAPSFPIIRISGAVTNPTITLKDFRGDTVETFGLTVTLTASEFRLIDMGLSRVTDESGLNAIAEWTSGDFFSLDPQDGVFPDGPFPTLEVSPDAACDALYRKGRL